MCGQFAAMGSSHAMASGTWYFAAELGLMLQLNALHMLEA
jgi:hypothetical protein